MSRWANSVFEKDLADLYLRVKIFKGVLRVQYSRDGLRWPLLRLCPFPQKDSFMVGPMVCTPERQGLKVIFSEFLVAGPNGKAHMILCMYTAKIAKGGY